MLAYRVRTKLVFLFLLPCLHFFLYAEWSTMGSGLLGIPDVCWDTVTLTPYPSATLHSPFIFSWYIISFQFSTIHHSRFLYNLSPCFSDILWSEKKTHICCPVPSQVVSKAVVFMCMCVCVRFLFCLSQPATLNKNQKDAIPFLCLKNNQKQIYINSWYKLKKQLNKHGRNSFIYAIR